MLHFIVYNILRYFNFCDYNLLSPPFFLFQTLPTHFTYHLVSSNVVWGNSFLSMNDDSLLYFQNFRNRKVWQEFEKTLNHRVNFTPIGYRVDPKSKKSKSMTIKAKHKAENYYFQLNLVIFCFFCFKNWLKQHSHCNVFSEYIILRNSNIPKPWIIMTKYPWRLLWNGLSLHCEYSLLSLVNNKCFLTSSQAE